MSGASGTIRKIFDVGPTTCSSNGSFNGSGSSTTGWSTGLLTPGSANQCWLTANWTEGATDSGRVGQSVAVEAFDLRILVTPQDTVIGHKKLRLIVCADNECDGTNPAITDLLGDVNAAAADIATGIELSFLQPAYLGRFQVIMDRNWEWYCSSTANSFTEISTKDGHSFYHEEHHDMKNHRIMWDVSDASVIANARRGHIFMFGIFSNRVCNAGGLLNNGATSTVTTADPPAISYCARMRFHDDA